MQYHLATEWTVVSLPCFDINAYESHEAVKHTEPCRSQVLNDNVPERCNDLTTNAVVMSAVAMAPASSAASAILPAVGLLDVAGEAARTARSTKDVTLQLTLFFAGSGCVLNT